MEWIKEIRVAAAPCIQIIKFPCEEYEFMFYNVPSCVLHYTTLSYFLLK